MRDLGTCISARARARSSPSLCTPELTCTLFSRARSRHSRWRAFAVTRRDVPKRRANETVRNWFNEVGRSWRCARDEQYELLKRGRTGERARASERAREGGGRGRRAGGGGGGGGKRRRRRQSRAEHVKGDLKGKRRRWPMEKERAGRTGERERERAKHGWWGGKSMANRSQPPLVSWKLSCNRAR